jgi:hypothetical protein
LDIDAEEQLVKVFTFAAGFAAGYVLGSRAGREKYEQIVVGWQKLTSHPTVVQTQEKAKDLLASGTQTVTAKLEAATPDDGPSAAAAPASTPRPRPARRKTTAETSTSAANPTA